MSELLGEHQNFSVAEEFEEVIDHLLETVPEFSQMMQQFQPGTGLAELHLGKEYYDAGLTDDITLGIYGDSSLALGVRKNNKVAIFVSDKEVDIWTYAISRWSTGKGSPVRESYIPVDVFGARHEHTDWLRAVLQLEETDN